MTSCVRRAKDVLGDSDMDKASETSGKNGEKSIFVLDVLLALLNAGYARADFEAVETVLGKLEDVQKEAQNVRGRA